MTQTTPAYLRIADDGSATVTLQRGYKRDGAQVRAITMREPTVGDQLIAEAASQRNGEREVVLFANLTGCTPDEIRSLTMRDYGRLQVAYTGFTD